MSAAARAPTPMPTMSTSSPEAELLRELEELIRKLATGDASENDIQRLHDLQRRRIRFLRPKVSQQRETA